MDDWLDLIIFAVVIIANIIGGIIKIKQKKKAAQHKLPPPTNDDEFDEYGFEEEYSGEFSETESQYVAIPVNEPEKVIKNDVPCRGTATENTNNFCSKQTIEVTDSEDEEDSFDYGEFMRNHGREAFVLAEIILPANSRQGK